MSINSKHAKSFSKLENVLIIGNGGRENSLAWAIQKNDLIKKIFLIPGNAGSQKINKCERILLDINNNEELIKKLTLAKGLGDTLRKNGFKVFGPGKDGAKLEYSKSWAKEFMQRAEIPTAKFWKINSLKEAKEVINKSKSPLVVKADGLASGKGVFIPETKDECLEAIEAIFNGKFGNAGRVIVLEERITGPEVSVFALCDGEKYILLPSAQDHKRLNDLNKDYLERIIKQIINPTIKELQRNNIEYRGVLYFGLMLTKSGPKVIEYNCRFGDPECQTIMPLMDKDFVILLQKCAMGKLIGNEAINASKKVSGCVIATSKGYPLEYKTGYPINIGKIDSENCQIFDSGTRLSETGDVLTDGGRVLSLVCQDKDFDKVFEKAYRNIKEINFEGIYFRNDIGHQVRTKLSKGN